MRLSKLFTKTTRQNPADEVSVNAQLLERGGFVYKNNAGVYTYLPLGWRVIQKIQSIIREEMNAIGGQEMLMPALIDKKYYEAAGRGKLEVGFKTDDGNFIMSWTHEEIMTAIAARFVGSYKDFPFATYQIQTKFRNEKRAKSGMLRGKEFMMKDMYSFHASESDLYEFYESVAKAYTKIFERCGLKAYYTIAAGGDFTTNNTHEFQVLTKAGEDIIYLCPKCEYAINKEISDVKMGDPCPKCGEEVIEEKSIEVGNIFPYGSKYADALGLSFIDEHGEKKPVITGAYGIGLGRVMGTVVEVHHDDNGIVWPDSLAPFRVHLIALPGGEAEAEQLYSALHNSEILFDDRPDKTAGEKFADADLIGCPFRIVISKKTVLEGSAELKQRHNGNTQLIHLTEVPNQI